MNSAERFANRLSVSIETTINPNLGLGVAGRRLPGTFSSPDLSMMLVVLLWGSNFAIIKASLREVSPLTFTALRFSLATVLLLGLLRWYEGSLALPRGHFARMLWLGLIGNTGYQILFVNGLARTTSANGSLIISSTPIIVALAGNLIGLERINRYIIIGMSLAFSGILIVMLSRGAAVSSRTVTGDLLVLGSSFCWAIYVLGMKAVSHEISPLKATTYSLVTGMPGLLLLGLPGIVRTDWTQVGPTAVGGILYSSIFALVVCYLLHNRAVRLIGGVRTTIYGCIIPIVAALVAWPMLGERPTAAQGAGAALIISGVFISGRKQRSK